LPSPRYRAFGDGSSVESRRQASALRERTSMPLSDLLRHLQLARVEALKNYMRKFKQFLPFSRNLKPEDEAEYNRIENAINELQTNFDQLIKGEGPDPKEYVERMNALLERDRETFDQLTEDLQRLLIKVVSID
jgi:hypothetical protein